MRKSSFLILFLFLFTGVLSAQAKGLYTPFGKSGMFEPTYNPGIKAVAPPAIGKQFTTQYTGTVMTFVNTFILVTGFSNKQWGSINLPFPIDQKWFAGISITPGTNLLVSMDVIQHVYYPWWPTKPVSLSMTIPNDPVMIGANFYQQWIVISSGAIPGQSFIQLTCGAHGVIGK